MAVKRVLFLDHISFLGGGQQSLLTLMEGLRQSGGFEPRLLLAPGEFARAARRSGYAVHTFGFNGIARSWNPLRWIVGVGLLASAVWTIVAIVREHDVRVVHANSLKTAVPCGLAARLAGRKAVFHARDFLAAGLLKGALVWSAYWLCHRVIVNSRAVAAIYGSDPAGKVSVVYNQVDCIAPLDTRRRHELRAAAGVSRNDHLMGFVGRLHPEKGIEVMLAALALVRARRPEVRLWLIGAPMPGEEPYQGTLLDQARRLGVVEAVRFWGWRRDAVELMGCFDLCVVPSLNEPFGRVTVEAMLMGVPVVATAAGGTLEIIQDGREGLLVKPGDAAALACGCLTLIGDPILAERLARHAKETARTRFGKAQYVNGVLAVYDALAGG